MGFFRSRSLLVVVALGLATLALRPVPVVDRALALALAPCRGLVELCVPLEWLQLRQARAAQRDERFDPERELARHLELEELVRASALPERFELAAGTRAAHGEVVGRDGRDPDRVRVRVEGCRGLVPGLPVISGDWYVGVVADVDEEPGGRFSDVWVQLITDQNERVAARVVEADDDPRGGPADLDAAVALDRETCRLVAGGLVPRADTLWLDVHNPSRRAVRDGLVLVDEREELGGRYTTLASGAWLGELRTESLDGRELMGIRPGLDYGSGLYQVLVLYPDGLVQDDHRTFPPVLEDGRWVPARRFLRAEPSPWRHGVWISVGQGHGVVPGAAVAAGARLCGRIAQVGVFRSSVLELGDPGFAIAALAIVERDGRREPFVMGRIESRGRRLDGSFTFVWEATVPVPLDPGRADGGAPLAAEIWTGSGERGVPRGLWVGQAELPRGPGPHELVIVPPPSMARAGAWHVRTEVEG